MTKKQTPEIISRKEAKALGCANYFTGKPCKHGHVALRYTSTGQCSICVAAFKKSHGTKSEKAKIGAARRNKRWIDKNKTRLSEQRREWRKNNPETVRMYVINRRALREKATPSWYGEFDEFVIQEAADLAKRREVSTGVKWHVDHMIPLKAIKARGLHAGMNIQVIPAAMNVAKGNKMILTEPGEWVHAL